MKKIIALITILALSSFTFAETSTFIDINEGDWYYTYVSEMKESKIISGYEDGTFRAGSTISVEEFVTFTVKTIGEDEAEVIKLRWSDGFIKKAEILQLIQDNEFDNYQRPITRGEMSRIILRAADIEVPDDYLTYSSEISDFDTMDAYWQNIALRVYSGGIISGYPDGSFKLDGQANRAEAAAILYKVYDPTIFPVIDPVEDEVVLSREDEIKALWTDLKPKYDGDTFVTEPSIVAPYSPGLVNEAFLQDGLNMLNFIRELAYLDGNVYLTSEANDIAQKGALLNAVSEFSHTPTKPTDMDQLLYDAGYDATSSSNLAAGLFPLSKAIRGLIDDEDANNIERIGHRRWFLAPDFYETGFGYVKVDDNYRHYMTAKVFRDLERKEVEYDTIAWPSAVAFPIEFINAEVPWSISLNSDMYDNSRTDAIEVIYSNETTGQSITLNSQHKDIDGHYFNVETSNYAIPFCIIFRPSHNEFTLSIGDLVSIKINNVYTKSGNRIAIDYSTQFFTLE